MSAVISVSAGRRYGTARVCRVWGVARSSVYRLRGAAAVPPAARRRPGPQGPMPDAALVGAIRRVLTDSPFHGEGYRKVWARLRHAGLRTSKERVRRLMRENGLSAATRVGRPRGPRNHDGTIIPERIDAMWGTDMTATVTVEHGQVAVFVAVDHRSAECTGIHAALRATRHEALEPIRQGVLERFGGIAEDIAQDLSVRHDHGSQYMSHDFQREVAWLGATSSPAFVPRPRGQRLRREVHPDPEGEPALGPDLCHRRGAEAGPPRVPPDLQRTLADRAPRTPLASPVPTRSDRQAADGPRNHKPVSQEPGAVHRRWRPRQGLDTAILPDPRSESRAGAQGACPR